jgi:hypothetical protein
MSDDIFMKTPFPFFTWRKRPRSFPSHPRLAPFLWSLRRRRSRPTPAMPCPADLCWRTILPLVYIIRRGSIDSQPQPQTLAAEEENSVLASSWQPVVAMHVDQLKHAEPTWPASKPRPSRTPASSGLGGGAPCRGGRRPNSCTGSLVVVAGGGDSPRRVVAGHAVSSGRLGSGSTTVAGAQEWGSWSTPALGVLRWVFLLEWLAAPGEIITWVARHNEVD